MPLSRTRKLLLAGALLASVAAVPVIGLAPLSFAQDSDQVVARVNGMDIRQSDLALAEEDFSANMPPMAAEAKREYLVNYVANLLLAAKAGEGQPFAQTDAFKRKLAYARNKLLMEQYLQTEAKAAATDEALRKVYDEAASQMAAEKEVRARHILVETEEEAKALAGEIKKGADFAELAKTKSKDPGASDGGDLGYFTKDQMVPEFSEVAFKMEKGQVSDPVKSQFGWHVIKVEDKRDRQIPPFDKVRDQVETFVIRKAQADIFTKLREGAKIERLDAAKAPEGGAPAGGAAGGAAGEKK